MKVTKIKNYLKKRNLNNKNFKLRKISKNDVIQIQFLNLFLKKFKKKTILGICIKKKNNSLNTIAIRNKIKGEGIKQFLFLNSPLILTIKKIIK